jgi:AcrR family transcriptional regulator
MTDTATARRIASTEVVLPEGATPAGTRGRILEAALGLFAESGFHGTSIRSIGAAAGINSATLYSHYASKEEVLRDLVMIGLTELEARLTEATASLSRPSERLSALVHAHVKAHASFAMLAMVTNDELHALSPELAGPALEIRAALFESLHAILAEGQRDGVFHPDDVDLAALAIAGMGVSVATWYVENPTRSPDVVAAQFARFALQMAGVR